MKNPNTKTSHGNHTHGQLLVHVGGALGVAAVQVSFFEVALVLLQHAGVLVQAAEGLAEGRGDEHDARPWRSLALHKATQLVPGRKCRLCVCHSSSFS